MATSSRNRTATGVFVLFCLPIGTMLPRQAAAADPAASPTPHRVYSHLLQPREHPDYDRCAAKPPTWENFGNRTQFTSLRNFRLNASGDLAADYVKDLDRYTRQYELGDVLWPYYDFLRAKNVGDLVAEIERRHLYVFDIWGYVPGSGPSAQFRAPPRRSTCSIPNWANAGWAWTPASRTDATSASMPI